MRPYNWPTLLSAFVARKKGVPFAWGANDCCTFTADWLFDLTGIDPAADLRGTYSTALGGHRVIKKRGGVIAIADAHAAISGWSVALVSKAQRGDMIAADTPHGPALGVCIGADSVFACGALVPTLKCIKAWRVG